jgi:hypothetical protein
MVGTAHSNNGINVTTLTFNSTTTPVIPTYPNTICGAPVASPSCSAPSTVAAAAASIYVFSKDFAQPFVQQANIGLEYEIVRDWSVSGTYLGVRARQLPRTRDINTPTATTLVNIPITGTTSVLQFQQFTGARPIAGFVRISRFESTARSTYHGGTLQVNKRYAHNYQFALAYTWSKVIDDNPDATAVVPFGSDDAKMAYNPALPGLDRAVGNNDQRHRLVVSGVWDLNYTGGMNAVGKAILGGWQLSAIVTAEGGLPYTGLVNFDLNGDGNNRNERTPGGGRNNFRHDKIIAFDPRLTKTIPIAETLKFQFIMEAFNIFNRANVGPTNISPVAVNTTQFTRSTSTAAAPTGCGGPTGPLNPCLIANPLFGTPTAVRDPRIIQFAAKIVF